MEDINLGQQLQIWSKTSQAILQFGVFSGQMQVSVNLDRRGKPEFGKPIPADVGIVIKEVLEKLLGAPPNTKLPVTRSFYSKEDKKYNVDHVITFYKDDANCYHVEVQFQNNGTAVSESFQLSLVGGVEVGTEPMDAAAKSTIKLKQLIQWFSDIGPNTAPFSKKKWKGPSGGGNNNSGGNKDNPFS